MTRRLPNGDYTEDTQTYIDAWRSAGRKFADFMSAGGGKPWHLSAFDPSFSFAIDSSYTVDIPTAVVLRVNAMLERIRPRERATAAAEWLQESAAYAQQASSAVKEAFEKHDGTLVAAYKAGWDAAVGYHLDMEKARANDDS